MKRLSPQRFLRRPFLAKAFLLLAMSPLCGQRAEASAAEDLEIFRASRFSDDAWAWGQARVKRKNQNLIFTERNDNGEYGDAYTADRFPFFRDGVVEVDVAQVFGGRYVFQVLGFEKDVHVTTADLIASTTQTGKRTFKLSDFYMPDGVDQIAFKVWVERAEGAAVAIAEVFYHVPIPLSSITARLHFTGTNLGWKAESITARAVAGHTALLHEQDAKLGSLLYEERLQRDQIDRIVLSLLLVKNGFVTLQFACFDSYGTYMDSVDVLKDLGTGVHARRLDQVPWPEGAASFQMKLWLSGEGAAAVVKEIVLLSESGRFESPGLPPDIASPDPGNTDASTPTIE